MLIRAANFGIILHIESCDIRITTDFTYYRDVLIEDERELMYKLLDIKMELQNRRKKNYFEQVNDCYVYHKKEFFYYCKNDDKL